MEQKIHKNYVILIIFIILVVGFYWFIWRPSHIKKTCMKNAQQGISNVFKEGVFNVDQYMAQKGDLKAIDSIYSNCLKERGL